MAKREFRVYSSCFALHFFFFFFFFLGGGGGGGLSQKNVSDASCAPRSLTFAPILARRLCRAGPNTGEARYVNCVMSRFRSMRLILLNMIESKAQPKPRAEELAPPPLPNIQHPKSALFF